MPFVPSSLVASCSYSSKARSFLLLVAMPFATSREDRVLVSGVTLRASLVEQVMDRTSPMNAT